MPNLQCPKCGDRRHLYDHADIRWDPDTRTWAMIDTEDCLECTTCDWTGTEAEAHIPNTN